MNTNKLKVNPKDYYTSHDRIMIDSSVFFDVDARKNISYLLDCIKNTQIRVIILPKTYKEVKEKNNPQSMQLMIDVCVNLQVKRFSFDGSWKSFLFNSALRKYKCLLLTNNATEACGVLESAQNNNITNIRCASIVFGEVYNIQVAQTNQHVTAQRNNQLSSNVSVTSKTGFKLYSGNIDKSKFDDRMSEHQIPKAGDMVKFDGGIIGKLNQEIGAGGEGIVYRYSADNTMVKDKVAKIYKSNNQTKVKEEKIRLMVANKISHKNICWPQELVYNSRNEFVGYTMQNAKGDDLKALLSPRMDVVLQRFPKVTKIDMINLCISILEAFDSLHRANVLVGDIKLENIVAVHNDINKIVIVDTDSFQIDKFCCPVMTKSFIAPEIIGKNASDFYRTLDHEYFAIAALIFSIFNFDKQPFTQKQTATDYNYEQLVKLQMFPYFIDQVKTKEHAPGGVFPNIWAHFPKFVKEAFISCFCKGKKRLSTREWIVVFEKYKKLLVSGRLNVDSECMNMYSISDIDYSVVDILPVETVVKKSAGFKMEQAIRNIISMLKVKIENAELDDICNAMSNVKNYTNKSTKVNLISDNGLIKRVQMTVEIDL